MGLIKYFLQKYKKYLVVSTKSCNFAPQFAKKDAERLR